MKKLYTFSATVPMIYNAYDIRENERESQFLMGLDEDVVWCEEYKVREIVEWNDNIEINRDEFITYRLSCGRSKEGNVSIPENHFMLYVDNIVCDNEDKAYELISGTVHRVCLILSYQISMHNCNKQGFQPRVTVDNYNIEWTRRDYEPFSILYNEKYGPREYIDEKGNKHIELGYTEFGIEASVAMSTIIYGNLSGEKLKKLLDAGTDSDIEFVLEEFFTAQGTEHIYSKFYHLFSIIEFVEKKYKDLSGACVYLNEKELEKLIHNINTNWDLDKNKKQRVSEKIKGALVDMTDIGRAKKLANILNQMNIKSIDIGSECFEITKDNIQKLINLRNIRFHGNNVNVDDSDKHIPMNKAVVYLMEICQKIIQYMFSLPSGIL